MLGVITFYSGNWVVTLTKEESNLSIKEIGGKGYCDLGKISFELPNTIINNIKTIDLNTTSITTNTLLWSLNNSGIFSVKLLLQIIGGAWL